MEPYKEFLISFARNANAFAAFYGCPVWLTGSAIHKENPRDYDIRVVLDSEDANRLFGYEENRWWKVAYWNLKISRILSRSFKKNVDFQIQFDDSAYSGKPRVRLDTATNEFFQAGKNEDTSESFYRI